HYYLMDFITFLDKDNTEVENCTEKEIMLYLAYLQQKKVSNLTKKYRLYALKHYFDYQIETEKRNHNPVKRIKIKETQKQKIYPILKPEELQTLHTNYRIPNTNDTRSHHNWFRTYKLSRERNKVIISLLIHQGITTAETGRIQLEDL